MTKGRFIATMVGIFTVIMLLTVVLGYFLYSQDVYIWVDGENLLDWSLWKYVCGGTGFVAMFVYWLLRRSCVEK